MNVLPARVAHAGDRVVFRLADAALTHLPLQMPEREVGRADYLGIRPEDLRLATEADEPLLPGRILLIERLGEVQILHVEVGAAKETPLRVKVPGTTQLDENMTVVLGADPDAIRLIDAEGIAPCGHSGQGLSAARRLLCK